MTKQDEIRTIRHALDELGLALTDHDHVWSPELRATFDAADRLLRMMEKIQAADEPEGGVGSAYGYGYGVRWS